MQKNDKEHMLGKKIPNNSSFPFQIKKKKEREIRKRIKVVFVDLNLT